MGPAWNKNYKNEVAKRVGPGGYKERGKKEKFYKGLAEVWKLVLNGGSFGKMNDRFSVQYDPFPHFSVTIGNQFEILMLIEALEIEGIHVISANTDGILSHFPESLHDKYMQICNDWEVVIGNDKLGRLEYVDYKMIAQTSVNDYIAVDTKGNIKAKGDFSKDKELNKNKSRRIIPIALEQNLINGIPIEDTIKNHRNIYDFCIGKKSSTDYHYRGIDRKKGIVEDIENRIVRYYCSTKELGKRLYKIKREHSEKKGPKVSKCESKSEYQVLFDIPFNVNNWEDYSIDYEYYISECYKILDQFFPEGKRDRKITASKQIQMFS